LTRLTANVMRDFVDHYEKKGAVGIVEACIVNVDVADIDVEQVNIRTAHTLGLLLSFCRSLT